MSTLNELPTPALLLDLDRLESNIGRMAQRARRLGVSLRPHVKTHKSIEIGRLQQTAGAEGITVATLEEAATFIDAGFQDLTWAFPVILGRIREARALAERATLRLLIDSLEALDALEATGFPFHVWLKIDCGYHRAGVDPLADDAVELARRLHVSHTLRFDGILTHAGHSYDADSVERAATIARQERDVMVSFAERLRAADIRVPKVSVGSTPTMSRIDNLSGVDEMRPGNYAFYDYTQSVLGSCTTAECAVTVLASVVSAQPGAAYAISDAGALALSKDPGPAQTPQPTLGEIYSDYAAGVLSPDLRLTSLSQEHGKLSSALPVGSRIRILPNHSCLTVACFDHFQVVRGDDVVGRWQVLRGR